MLQKQNTQSLHMELHVDKPADQLAKLPLLSNTNTKQLEAPEPHYADRERVCYISLRSGVTHCFENAYRN